MPANLTRMVFNERNNIREIYSLYQNGAPAALAIASDFWRMTAVGAVAASLSEDDLGVFNASYRIMWMAFTLTGSLGGAIATKLGLRLGAGDAKGARRGVRIGFVVSVVLLSIIVLVVITIPRQLAKIFTNDSKLLDLFERCRYEFAAALFMMNFAVVCERVPFGMGRAKAVLYAGAVGSWVGQVPAVIFCVEFWRKDLRVCARASLPDMPLRGYWGSSCCWE